MASFVAQRLISIVPVLFGVSLLVFGMLHLIPGDPAVAMIGQGGASSEEVEVIRERLGLNDPLYVQYGRFLVGVVTGDLGRSIRTHQPVTTEITSQLGSTVELAVVAVVLALGIGTTLGLLAAYFHNTWIDSAMMFLALLGVALPSFWLGLMLLFVFAVQLGWVPIIGEGGFERLVLPAITLGFVLSAPIARMTRSSMLDVLNLDYIRTARAKGLREVRVVMNHALMNAFIPVVTLVGLQFGSLLAGTVIIETVFARRGIGSLVVTAILNRDLPIVQGVVMLMAVTFVLINLSVDIIYGWLDPRIRHQG